MLYLIPKGSPKVAPLFIFVKKLSFTVLILICMVIAFIGLLWFQLRRIKHLVRYIPRPVGKKSCTVRYPSSTALINVLFHITSISQHVCVLERVWRVWRERKVNYARKMRLLNLLLMTSHMSLLLSWSVEWVCRRNLNVKNFWKYIIFFKTQNFLHCKQLNFCLWIISFSLFFR